jgi:hypothetical protein
MLPQELVAPITVDLRNPPSQYYFDIIKGLENINYVDAPLLNPTTTNFAPGDWAWKQTGGFAPPPTGNAPANVYPVVVGNNEYDSLATGNISVIEGGHFMYNTTKLVAGSYTLGQNLCVKNLGGGEQIPSAAGTNDAVVARVYDMNVITGIGNVYTVEVLNR